MIELRCPWTWCEYNDNCKVDEGFCTSKKSVKLVAVGKSGSRLDCLNFIEKRG